MKIIASFVVFHDDDIDISGIYHDIFNQLIENKYLIIKSSMGRHKDASREHYHISYVLDDTEKIHLKTFRKSKISYQRKINREIMTDNIETKLSVYIEADRDYDEKKGLGYPLKEYENYEAIEFRELGEKIFLGISPEELEELRAFAHANFIQSRANRRAKEEQQKKALTFYQIIITECELYHYNYINENCEVPQFKDYFKNMLRYFREEDTEQPPAPRRIYEAVEKYCFKNNILNDEYFLNKYF